MKMSELEYHKEFLNWLGLNGKVTENDLKEFAAYIKHRDEAKRTVDEMFKGQ